MINVLVTGANGQLGKCFRYLAQNATKINFIFKNSSELDITNIDDLASFCKNNNKVDYIINCAAYTNVDKAEQEPKKAYAVNAIGAEYLAKVCHNIRANLIHISTDFIFDGKKTMPYIETDIPNPQGVYGLSKLKGEKAIQETLQTYFIIRTSWLYSEHNANFMKTMIKLLESHDQLNVVNDQIGTPTYAKDLAEVILLIIKNKSKAYGIYHYSNEGVASWFDFAQAIFVLIKRDINLAPISSKEYPTLVKRPSFSVLNKTKIKNNFGIKIPHWRDSLEKAVKNLNKI